MDRKNKFKAGIGLATAIFVALAFLAVPAGAQAAANDKDKKEDKSSKGDKDKDKGNDDLAALVARVMALEQSNATLQAALAAEAAARQAADAGLQTQLASVQLPTCLHEGGYGGVGVAGDVVFSGCNVHVVNGLGATQSVNSEGLRVSSRVFEVERNGHIETYSQSRCSDAPLGHR